MMADQREFKIGVLAGDGIGPEITDATIEVLHTASERTGLKHHRPIHKLATKSCRASSMSAGRSPQAPPRRRGRSSLKGFARDSPLEEAGFKPSVPL